MRKCTKFGIYLQLNKTELTINAVLINRNNAKLLPVYVGSDQPKIEKCSHKYS